MDIKEYRAKLKRIHEYTSTLAGVSVTAHKRHKRIELWVEFGPQYIDTCATIHRLMDCYAPAFTRETDEIKDKIDAIMHEGRKVYVEGDSMTDLPECASFYVLSQKTMPDPTYKALRLIAEHFERKNKAESLSKTGFLINELKALLESAGLPFVDQKGGTHDAR